MQDGQCRVTRDEKRGSAGHMDNSRHSSPVTRHAFTLLELLVVIAIIGILAALLLPALSAAKQRAKSTQCLNDMKQILVATTTYLGDSNGRMVPLWEEMGATNLPPWTFDPATFIVQKPTYLWWPDKFRLDGLLPAAASFSCPALTVPASLAHGQCYSSVYTLGIGMNYPEYGAIVPASENADPVYASANEGQVSNPGGSIVYTDAGFVTNPDDDYDSWMEQPGTGDTYFRVPSDTAAWPGNDFTRSVPRHSKRLNAAFFDGHADKIKNSAIGYDLDRTNPAALWPRNNNGETP